jgi:hypothetical protein
MSLLLCFLSTVTASSTLCFSFSNSGSIEIEDLFETNLISPSLFALYQYFRKMLFREDILIVIGFSFRDPSINNAFADWLSTRPSSRLIIVARQEKQNKIRAIFDDNTRIQFIDTYFGQNGFINSPENASILVLVPCDCADCYAMRKIIEISPQLYLY